MNRNGGPNGTVDQALVDGSTSRFRTQPNGDDAHATGIDDRRPSSAPGNRDGTGRRIESRDDSGLQEPRRPVKPPLLRSKSEFAPPRQTEENEHTEENVSDWGARHGFEGHYQSEHVISQLANVCALPLPPP